MSYELVSGPLPRTNAEAGALGLFRIADDPPPASLGSPTRARAARDIVTVLFIDIEGFTRLAEALPLERTVEILAQYYGVVTAVTAATAGTVDRFIGDGALVYWAHTRHGTAHADFALESVRLLRQRLAAHVDGPRIAGGLPVRFGVHTGEAMVGPIGEGNETLVGDVVNVASRLQNAAKGLQSRAADQGLRGYVSRDTVRHLTGERPADECDRLALPGRKRLILAHRV